jgi:hypothetical protein
MQASARARSPHDVPADNLGSIAVITDETANAVERDGYAWGKRRFPNGADDPTGSLTSHSPPWRSSAMSAWCI